MGQLVYRYAEVTDKFSSLENALMTLFSVMNGDVILETSRELHKGALGDLYLVCFVAVGLYKLKSVDLTHSLKAPGFNP